MTESEDLFLNLAILKINWDDNKDIISNFMPIVGYALTKMPNDTVSTTELKEIIQEAANFRIPTGALESLIRRASRSPYHYTRKSGAVYTRDLSRIPAADFVQERQALTESYQSLFDEFVRYCEEKFEGDIEEDNAFLAFFDFIFEIAPHIARSAIEFFDNEKLDELNKSHNLKYKAANFIIKSFNERDKNSEVIESFVKGAILAESFYYTSPENVKSKFRDVEVYYDTRLLLEIMGFAADGQVEKARELHEMVRACQARPRVFEHNLQELYGIFNAALTARRSGPLRMRTPGDVFDYFNRKGSSASDIELEIGRFPSIMAKLGILSVVAPNHSSEYSIDEMQLSNILRDEIRYSNDTALYVDVDSLTAVFRLRYGRAQKYLESCHAIFVTTNSALASASTRFFNEQYGHSDAPVCMADHVFCMLLWLKVADKRPNVPTEILVATCMAALQPSAVLWDRYMEEVERLRSRNDISDNDYALLSYSLEARQALMELTGGDSDGFLVGSAVDVLQAAKEALAAEKDAVIGEGERKSLEQQIIINNAEDRIFKSQDRLAKILHVILSIFLIYVISILGWSASIVSASQILDGNLKWNFDFVKGVAAIIMIIATSLNLALGWSFFAPTRSLARKLARLVVR